MPRPRIHAHLTITSLEKEIADYIRVGQNDKAETLREICAKYKIPLSNARISDRVAQQELFSCEGVKDELSKPEM